MTIERHQASITIEGVKFVVDCGFVKVVGVVSFSCGTALTSSIKIRTYDGTIGLSSLKVVPISQASAIQRAGRAGRTSEGLCYRLYPFSAYNQLSTVAIPEISRTELSSAVLQLKALGVDNFMKLQWLTIPPSDSIAQSFSSLAIHSIIDDDGRLTSLGSKVAEIPLDVKAACVVGL